MLKQNACLCKLSIDDILTHKVISLFFVFQRFRPRWEKCSIVAIFVLSLRNTRTFVFVFLRSKIFMTTWVFLRTRWSNAVDEFFYFLFKFPRMIKYIRLAVKCLSVVAFVAEHCPEMSGPSFLPPSFYHKNEPQICLKFDTQNGKTKKNKKWFSENSDFVFVLRWI